MRFLGLVVILLCVDSVRLSAQEQRAACDSRAIQWFLPGQFAEALAKAKLERRILVIKGISFGLDEEGAKCATKGKW